MTGHPERAKEIARREVELLNELDPTGTDYSIQHNSVAILENLISLKRRVELLENRSSRPGQPKRP